MGVKVWVGNIPPDATEDDIRNEFRVHARVLGVQMKDEYCFIEFEDLRTAQEVVGKMHNHRIRGVGLKIQLSNDARRQQSEENYSNRKFGEGKVRIDNLPLKTEWQEVKDHFRRVGNVLRADILHDGMGNSIGSAIVIFEYLEEAKRAITDLDQTKFDGQVIRITLQNIHPRGGPKGKDGSRDRERSRSRSPGRNGGRGRSPSPLSRGRPRGRELDDPDRHRRDDFDPRDSLRGADHRAALRGSAFPALDRLGGAATRFADRPVIVVDDRGFLDNRLLQLAEGRALIDRGLPRDPYDDRGYPRDRMMAMSGGISVGLSGDRMALMDRRSVAGLVDRERMERLPPRDDRYLGSGAADDVRGYLGARLPRRSPSPPPRMRPRSPVMAPLGYPPSRNAYPDSDHYRGPSPPRGRSPSRRDPRDRHDRGGDEDRHRDRSPRRRVNSPKGPRTPPM